MKILIFLSLFLLGYNNNDSNCLEADIMILADISGSVGGNQEFIGKSISEFVNRFELSETGIKIGVIVFSDRASIMSGLTSDKNRLNIVSQLISNNPCGGNTNITAALHSAFNEIQQNGRNGLIKLVILISDGGGNVGIAEETYQAAEILKSTGTSICSIAILTGESDLVLMKSISMPACYSESNYNNLLESLSKMDICL